MLREEATLNMIASKYEIAPMILNCWKAEFLERAHGVIERDADKSEKRLEKFEEKKAIA